MNTHPLNLKRENLNPKKERRSTNLEAQLAQIPELPAVPDELLGQYGLGRVSPAAARVHIVAAHPIATDPRTAAAAHRLALLVLVPEILARVDDVAHARVASLARLVVGPAVRPRAVGPRATAAAVVVIAADATAETTGAAAAVGMLGAPHGTATAASATASHGVGLHARLVGHLAVQHTRGALHACGVGR